MMLDTVGAACAALLVGTVLLLIFEWIRVGRLYGGSKFGAFQQMFFTVRKSQSWWIFPVAMLSIGGTLYLLADPLFREMVPAQIVVPGLIAVPLAMLLIRLRPPAVLFLGSSRHGQRLFQSIRLNANRYRVIAFLAPSGELMSAGALMMDGFRTRRTVGWKRVVRRLVETVPLLVVDARTATPDVVEELHWLMQPHLRGRVIFVSTDVDTLPALDAVDNSMGRADLYITTEQNCAAVIRNRLRAFSRVAHAPEPTPRETGRPDV
jgi:hypothetical protein